MIHFANVTKTVGGVNLYEDASFQVYAGEKVGLVGPNGAGKTTAFRLLIKDIIPDTGAISIQGDIHMAYFSQHVGEMKGRTALQEVVEGHELVSQWARKMRALEDKLGEPDLDPDEMNRTLEKLGDAQTEYEKHGGFEVENNAQTILTGLGVEPADHDKPVEDFSSGWKMRIALAKTLIRLPDLILMDEPTNYLDMETILWLENWLRGFKGAILMTTHDRDFMNRVVNKIVEVDRGRITTYSGNYDFYEKEKAIRVTQQGAAFDNQQAMLKKEEDFIARFKARASHAAQVQSRVKKLEKIDRVEAVAEDDEIRIRLPNIPRGGNDVLILKDLGKSWPRHDGTLKPVFSGLSATVNRQDRIAIVGVNGAGKSTLLKVLCGQTPATVGEVWTGPSIDIGYFGQSSLEALPGESTVFEAIQSTMGNVTDGYVKGLLAAFLFRGDEIHKKIKVLSGGEKTRVVLATLFNHPHNCMVLDEPTNHLDIKSREVLLEALSRYEGTLLLVSHDRFFLREITTRVFEVDHGKISVYEGDYAYYLGKKTGS